MRLLTAMLVLAALACSDPKSGRPVGAQCTSDAECSSGACLVNVCLDPAGDEDGDGLNNETEAGLGTNLFDSDSDGDMLLDPAEVTPTFQPIDSDGAAPIDALESDLADSDGDCVSDQRDPDATDVATLVAAICKHDGVCGTPGALFAFRCDTGDEIKGAVCVYDEVPGWEPSEVSCDELDNDCDGVTDVLVEGECAPPIALSVIEVAPAASSTPLGVPISFSASGRNNDGSDATLGTVVWASSRAGVATIDQAGRATPVGEGVTTISATFGGISGEATLTVTAALAVQLEITPAAPRVAFDGTIALHALATLSDGTTDDRTFVVTWMSEDAEVATIDADGVVTAHAPGTTLITAALDDAQLDAAITLEVVVTLTPFVTASKVRAIAIDPGKTDGPGARATIVASPGARVVLIDGTSGFGGAASAPATVVSRPRVMVDFE